MSHELDTFSNGDARMAYVGETPWHRLGRRVPANVTSEEMLVAAGLDIPMVKRRLQTADGIIVPSAAIFRTDTGAWLGTVGKDWEPISNKHLLLGADPLVRKGLISWETAGVLHGGRKVWALARYDGRAMVRGEEILPFLLVSNGHDGTTAFRFDNVAVRVVCHNTLTWALDMGADGKPHRKAEGVVRHTKNWQPKMEEVVATLEQRRREFLHMTEIMESFAQAPCSFSKAEVMFEALCPNNPDAKSHTRAEAKRNSLLELFRRGAGNRGESIWDWYNAVTEYADGNNEAHALGVRGADKGDARLKSIYQGAGASMKRTAWTMSLAEVA